MGIIATYLDGEDKDAIVSLSTTTYFTSVYAILQRQFQSLVSPFMNVIGQCLENGDSSGTSALMDVYETLLVLVSHPSCCPLQRNLHAPLLGDPAAQQAHHSSR